MMDTKVAIGDPVQLVISLIAYGKLVGFIEAFLVKYGSH